MTRNNDPFNNETRSGNDTPPPKPTLKPSFLLENEVRDLPKNLEVVNEVFKKSIKDVE